MALLIYVDLVNLKYKTDFDILFIKLVRNTEVQFKKGCLYGVCLVIFSTLPFIAVRYFTQYSFFDRYFVVSFVLWGWYGCEIMDLVGLWFWCDYGFGAIIAFCGF